MTLTRGRGVAHGAPVLGQLGQPAALHPGLQLGRPGVRGEQHPGAGLVGPEGEHLAGVRIGRPQLGQQVVAVVPERDQAEVGDRRVRRRAVADHHPHVAPPGGEEGAVAGGRAGLGDQHRETGRAERLGAGRLESGQVALVRDDDHRPAAAVGAGPRGAGQTGGPVSAGGRRSGSPATARAAGRHGAAPPGSRRRSGSPAAVRRAASSGGVRSAVVGSACSVAACRGGMASRITSEKVPA